MKNSRFQYAYRENASKLHKAVGEILRTAPSFCQHEAYQEYPVNLVNTSYPDGRHHFDWVVPDLKLVIECHGIQHYKVVNWDGGDPQKAIEAFKALKERDFAKREAAWVANWIYVEISHALEKKISESMILSMIEEAKNAYQEFEITHTEQLARQRAEIARAEREKRCARAKIAHKERKEKYNAMRQEYLKSDVHRERLEKAKQLRRERYVRLKNGPREEDNE